MGTPCVHHHMHGSQVKEAVAMAEQFDDSDELLRRALLDAEATVAVALRIEGLALADELTVVFHARSDLGTVSTYVANGGYGTGAALRPPDLLRVPCDLDLPDPDSRAEGPEVYAEQARGPRHARQ